MTTVYDQLEAIVSAQSARGYLAHYANDLRVIDKEQLGKAQAGERYLWVLRSCGTQLFPIATGHDAIWATYWLDAGNDRSAPSLAYLIEIATDSAMSGTVKPVAYDRARRLANEPAPDGRRVKVSMF